MILKTLVTGVAAAAVVGGAAAGVTSVASGTITASPAVAPVVWDIPMPATPAPDLIGPLTQTVNTLGSGGSFAGKSSYIQGLGRFTGKGVEVKYNDAVAKGYLPLTATVDEPDLNGNLATANVTATLSTGEVRSMPLTFVQGPSPTGWQLSSQSLFALGDLVG
ncbi:hypothetical protein [Mycolicibacterium stellerae]|uniref:hypothetical protein n=1 Tax=Mycolicibacterium stellerae TaxID=2358193 RepID=UPI000F0B7581|nr:hypothetical protein [Mycolicibacterium stellerae]